MSNGMTKVLVTAALLSIVPGIARAADKTGVSPNTISKPTGPGSLEGLGDAFQPALNTGTARYTVQLSVPPGVAGLTPDISLQYDSGLGFGPVGIGWSFGPGSVRRQTEKGLPRYIDSPVGDERPDRFLGLEGEELVALENGHYLAKIARAYTRYRPVDNDEDGSIDSWVAQTKRGHRLEFGLTPSGRVAGPAGAYQWNLERQTDTNGNVIEYRYVCPDPGDRQVYLSEIRYGPGSPPWDNYYAVHMEYENRPDPFTDYRSGFKVRTARRLTRVDVKYNGALVRRYILGYGAHAHWSLLTTVTQVGDDGESTLPSTTFDYATFDLCDPETHISAGDWVIGSNGEPGQVLDNPLVELIDLNGDGLPDLLDTGTGHTVYLNRGVTQTETGELISWEGPADVDAADPRALDYQLSAGNVHLADMTGDGLADLVVTLDYDVEYFTNTMDAGWSTGILMSMDGQRPPAPFGIDADSVLTADLDFDKHIDIVQSQSGAYSTWFNLGQGQYSSAVLTDGAYYGAQFISFSDHGVQLADMNGDRLSDVVKITTSSVISCPNMGFGQFDECDETELHPDDPTLDYEHVGRAKMTDINGDGLADLVVEQFSGPDLRFWLNMSDGTFAQSRLITGLPTTSNAQTRWADINGNGTTDLIYADSTLPDSKINAIDIGELVAGSSHFNALTGIDNGYGRKTEITYRSTTEYHLDAIAAGNPWETSLPFPSAVVSRTETSIGLDLDGYPDDGEHGDVYITDFNYRDGYYDPLERQFRGFAFVTQIDHGDERFGGGDAPSLVTRHRFHTGAPDGLDNDGDGDIDESAEWVGREEEPLKGVELWREITVLPDDPGTYGQHSDDSQVFERIMTDWDVRGLCEVGGGALSEDFGSGYHSNDYYDRHVRQALRTVTHTSVIELGNGEPKELESWSQLDPLGNQLFEWNLGDLENPDDDLYTSYEYALNEAAWIVDRFSRKRQAYGGPGGAFVSETRHYYDGDAFDGLPLGQVGDTGNLHRTESIISAGPTPPLTDRSFAIGDPRTPNESVNMLRRQVDPYGNPIVLRDASDNDRRIDYDESLHAYPVTETIIVGGGHPDLVVSATYDYGFGKTTTIADANDHVTGYVYDTFGRLVHEMRPGDDEAAPSRTYTYDLGAPISSITSITRPNEGNSPDVVTTRFFDGLGRSLGEYEAGGPVMKDVTFYNTRGQARRVSQPFPGGDGNWSAPPGASPSTDMSYDARGRVTQTVTPPDEQGIRAMLDSVYEPLRVIEYDGEDTLTGGPHHGTPTTLVYDGLDRLMEVHEIETLSIADPGTFVTEYRYAMPDRLAEIQDANGNISYRRYDGLGRRIFLNDCDRGHTTHTYDAVGNLVRTVDAKGQETVYTYDGANRILTEDYLDSGEPLGFGRSPDIAYHYDQPSVDYPKLGNTLGRLAWVEDTSGFEFLGYSARGDLETVVKRVEEIDGSTRDYATVTLSDASGQPYQTVYPDGSVVRHEYDARGFLGTVPGFLSLATYTASGHRETFQLGNGITTNYDYDPRLRLTNLTTTFAAETFQDLSYSYDHADNIISITDGRVLPQDDPRNQTADFIFDNSYRLARAAGLGYGTIEYDYDRLGNMVSKTSPDIPDAAVNIGNMTSGGVLGTVNRIGRDPGDPPGPHALTAADYGTRQRSFGYDGNGNLSSADEVGYVYDFADRLHKIMGTGLDTRYLYDYKGRRIIKRVDGVQTTYIDRLSESRGGEPANYIFAGNTRVARIDGAFPPPEIVTQRISLGIGWNLFSFQVDPVSNEPSDVLAGIAGAYTAVYGFDSGVYTCYEPGAGANTLHTLLPNHGYWIHMIEPGDLLVDGSVSEVPVEVQTDTATLVGVPGLQTAPIETLTGTHPAIQHICTYAGTQFGWQCFERNSPDFLNNLTRTRPGSAYWILCGNATMLECPSAGDTRDITYYHVDHVGSTNLTTDAHKTVIGETAYYPFGEPRFDHQVGEPSFDPHYRFSNKELDDESGLHYFEKRYVLGSTGRFNRPDPLGRTIPDDWLLLPQKLNFYAYARNNPISFVDQTGEDEKPVAKNKPDNQYPDLNWMLDPQNRIEFEMKQFRAKEARDLDKRTPKISTAPKLTREEEAKANAFDVDKAIKEAAMREILAQDPSTIPFIQNLSMLAQSPLSCLTLHLADPTDPKHVRRNIELGFAGWGVIGSLAAVGDMNLKLQTSSSGVLKTDVGTVRGSHPGSPSGPLIPGAPSTRQTQPGTVRKP